MTSPEDDYERGLSGAELQRAYWDYIRAAKSRSPGRIPLEEAEALAEQTNITRHIRIISLTDRTWVRAEQASDVWGTNVPRLCKQAIHSIKNTPDSLPSDMLQWELDNLGNADPGRPLHKIQPNRDTVVALAELAFHNRTTPSTIAEFAVIRWLDAGQ